MSSSTPNLNLVLPVGGEHVSRAIINENNTKIDTFAGTANSSLNTLSEQIASKEFSPSNGDSLLTWIVGNISSRNALPFSFVKIGNATMSDIPAFNVPGTEFTGFVYGNSRRITVELSRYANTTYQRWVRHIFDNAWYGDWEQIQNKVAYIDKDVTPGTAGEVNINNVTSQAVTYNNFISALVINSNNCVCDVYTYSTTVYVRIHTRNDYATPVTSQLMLRIWYIN